MARLHVGLSDETSITQNLISYAYNRPTRGALGLLWKRLNAGGTVFGKITSSSG